MKFVKFSVLLAFFLFAVSFCAAAGEALDIESSFHKYTIVENNVVVQSEFDFENPVDGILRVHLPDDASAIDVYADGGKSEFKINKEHLEVSLVSAKKVEMSYVTEELIDNSNFLLNYPIADNIANFELVLVLPEEAVLKRPIESVAGSIFPKPDKTSTDGRSMMFTWQRSNLKEGDEISIFAMYKTQVNYLPYVIVLLILAFLGYIAYTRISFQNVLRKHAKKEEKEKENHAGEEQEKTKPQEKAETKTEILEHLKEDEQQIVRVLKQRENQCEQGTLRIVTGFSKAHLSRLISELEARKIIHKEKRGKKNLVFLK